MMPDEQQAQRRAELLVDIAADRQAMALSLHRLGQPFRTALHLKTQVTELAGWLPLLLSAALLLWWLRRRPNQQRPAPMLASTASATMSPRTLQPLVAATRWSYWSGLIQQIVDGWRLALQIRELLRLGAGSSRPGPTPVEPARTLGHD